MEWFYAQNGRQNGPVTLEALAGMLQAGNVRPGDLVWREGMGNWAPAGIVPELAQAVPGGNASLNYFNPVAPTGAPPVYAGFWLRWVAALIDGIALWMVGYIIGLVTALQQPMLFRPGMPMQPRMLVALFSQSMLGFAIAWLYHALMECSRYQGSLGKLALGIIVTDMCGQRIGFGRATGRYFGKILSSLTIYIGYMMAGWTQQKQALHDIMAGCLVMRKQ